METSRFHCLRSEYVRIDYVSTDVFFCFFIIRIKHPRVKIRRAHLSTGGRRRYYTRSCCCTVEYYTRYWCRTVAEALSTTRTALLAYLRQARHGKQEKSIDGHTLSSSSDSSDSSILALAPSRDPRGIDDISSGPTLPPHSIPRPASVPGPVTREAILTGLGTLSGTLSKKASGELRGRRRAWAERIVQAPGRAAAAGELTGSIGQGFAASMSRNASELCAGRGGRSRKRKALVLVLAEPVLTDPFVFVRPLLPLLLPFPDAPSPLLAARLTIGGFERVPCYLCIH